MRNSFVLFNDLFTLTEDLRKADLTACTEGQARLCKDVVDTCVDHWMRLFVVNPKVQDSKLRNLSEQELDRLEELIALVQRALALVEANA